MLVLAQRKRDIPEHTASMPALRVHCVVELLVLGNKVPDKDLEARWNLAQKEKMFVGKFWGLSEGERRGKRGKMTVGRRKD